MFSTQSSGAVNAAVNAVTDVANGAANAVTNVANGAANAVTNVANGAANAVTNVANGAANAVTNAGVGAANAATNLFQSVNKAANTAVNTVAQNIPSFNSLIPIGNSSSGANANAKPANANVKANNAPTKNLFGNLVNRGNNANNRGNNAGNNGMAVQNSIVGWFNPLYIFIGLVLIFLVIFTFYSEQIKTGYEYIVGSLRNALGMPVNPDVTSAVSPVVPLTPVTVAPEAPQDTTLEQESMPQPSQKSIVERVLPSSGGEVFNVAQNKFTYYDAEPLCKALGAELATYEQVKDAWGQGADWCNYGWVKGQMAVYPTQSETYDKLQSGPDDQKRACGTVGINGGYFDNPEFKYGVNCYGKKPNQSAHDQMMLMSQGKAPKSPDALRVDQLVNEFKDESDSLFIKPFNNEKWVSA
jgi:hypothetical protein